MPRSVASYLAQLQAALLAQPVLANGSVLYQLMVPGEAGMACKHHAMAVPAKKSTMPWQCQHHAMAVPATHCRGRDHAL
jgi:hypothetical protein